MTESALPASPEALLNHRLNHEGALTAAWLRRDTPLSAIADLLLDPASEKLEELAVFGAEDTGPLLTTIAAYRPASLRMLRFGATAPVDLEPHQEHLAGFSRLALSGPVRTGELRLANLSFLGWADRRGNRVQVGPGTLAITELWTRTTSLSLQRFLTGVTTPNLTRLTVADPTPLLHWRGIDRLEHLTVTTDTPRIQAVVAGLQSRRPDIFVQFGRQGEHATAA